MLKIGDFSRLARVSVKTLRYYDDFGLLKPVQVDRATGYRYYAAEQLPRLTGIMRLKELGLSLEETLAVINGDLSQDQILFLLKAKRADIRQRLDDEGQRLEKVEQFLSQMEKEVVMPEYEVRTKSIKALRVVSVRDVIPTYGDIGHLFEEFMPYFQENKLTPVGPPLAIYYDGEYKEKDVDVEVACPVMGEAPAGARIKPRELPAEELVASLVYQGAYEGISSAYAALMGWAEKNGYEICGPDREIFLKGPESGEDASQYVTELQLPVKKS